MDNENRIAVMGDYDSIYGFASLGLATFPVEGEEEALKTLKNLAGNGFGIIYITEEMGVVCAKQIAKYNEMMTPAIIQIPGVKGNTGDGIMAVRRSVEKAVGSDILFGE